MQAEKHMHEALKLARKGIGKVSPNPLVGCVIVKNNQIIATGYHQIFGGPHAEINALKVAGQNARGAEMFVTLEPCCHYGKTPPCTEAILNAGIQKVSVAMLDPNPLVAGKGITFLEKNGIKIELGIAEKKARELNEIYLHFIEHKTPFIALKIATTLDGKITRSDGKQWISNQKSRYFTHKLREKYDAVLIGKKTALIDNPRLKTYLIKTKKNPLRIILDTNLEIPLEQNVFNDTQFILVTKKGHLSTKLKPYLKKGGKILEVGEKRIDLKQMLKKLGKMSVSSLLVEGGAEIFTSFLNQNLAQKIYWFTAPLINGQNGQSAFNLSSKLQKLQNIRFKKIEDNWLTIGYL